MLRYITTLIGNIFTFQSKAFFIFVTTIVGSACAKCYKRKKEENKGKIAGGGGSTLKDLESLNDKEEVGCDGVQIDDDIEIGGTTHP